MVLGDDGRGRTATDLISFALFLERDFGFPLEENGNRQ